MDLKIADQIFYETGSCVYLLHCGSKFLIIKGKSLCSSIYFLEYGYLCFLTGGPNTPGTKGKGQKPEYGKNTYYYPLYRYLKKFNHPCYIEIVIEDENPANLLYVEAEMLDRYYSYRKCLNTNSDPYIPKWINQRAVEDYKKLRQIPASLFQSTQ